MAFKNSSIQIIKLVLAGLTVIALPVGLVGMSPTFVYLFSPTVGTADPFWPAKLTYDFKAFFIIN
jgi:hypothetical protein